MTPSFERPLIALDAFTFPLYGRRLIEASAGTGKTYTIANLYLRLLMPTQDDCEFPYPLTVDQILVVTFTEAATAELKGRIRQRIRQARKALLMGESNDAFLSSWIARFSSTESEVGVERLLNAEKQMDEAAIFTIHGFCQRMLAQNAFESRMLFQQEIETDESIPLSIAVKDVWRSETYPMSPEFAGIVRRIWDTPQALQNDLASVQSQPSVKIQGADFDVERCLFEAKELIQKARQLWQAHSKEVIELLDNSDIKGTFWYNTPKKMDAREKVIRNLFAWGESDSLMLIDELKRIDGAELESNVKKGGAAPEHPLFESVKTLRLLFPDSNKVKPALLSRYWALVQDRLIKWKQQTLKLTFTDLLTSMDFALQNEGGERLADRIQHLYPVAMIDEFQDTDPIQYRIFSTIYQDADSSSSDGEQSDRALGLIMIGDPKQAIYAFRGADVYTYLEAKKDVEAVYSLATNYRSSAAMIQSVNQLFMTQAKPFRVEGIPFTSVQDRGIEGGFVRQNQVQTAMQFLLLEQDDVLSTGSYEERIAEMSATHIHALLLEGQKGQATLKDKNQASPVMPKDIAILVAGYRQAQLMKQSLAEKGINSVYLSDRGSVFASSEAQDLWIILHAIHEQGKETPLRSALATKLLSKSYDELDKFNYDDVYFEQWSERFQHYHDIWLAQGLMPMLRRFMQDLKLASDILSRVNGERSLTNLLHLGEKLQQKSMEMESQESLLRYFLRVIQSPDGNSDEQKVRLESDAELVRIITIHKSKGLEYPLVYLPFALKPFANRDDHALYHSREDSGGDRKGNSEADGERNSDLSETHSTLWFTPCPEKEQKELHEEELYATEIRLAYVALTRAKEACFIGCAEIGKAATKTLPVRCQMHLSGVGSLLYAGEDRAFGSLETTLMAFNELSFMEVVRSVPDTLPVFKQNRLGDGVVDEGQAHILNNREFSGHIERDWWIGSYSSLVIGDESHKKAEVNPGLDETGLMVSGSHLDRDLGDHVPEPELLTELAIQSANLLENEDNVANRFSFPRGAKPGVFLHDLLEGTPLLDQLNDPTFANLLLAQYQPAMADYFERQGYGEWRQVLFVWLRDMLHTPLDKNLPELTLAALSAHQVYKEMEFFIPVSGFKALQLDRIARRYDDVSKDAPSIQDRPLKGMLKGFIDLLFEWEGRYYVVDYKSNYLGDSPDDYHDQALKDGIADHRYDLQYQLYTLALHRYLGSRLEDYDYDKHIGGVFYLFLRGMDGESQQGIYRTRLEKAQVLEMDALFSGANRAKETIDQPSIGPSQEDQYDLF
ncbi:exodeoxyribonuclease V subunit beta [Marinomonas sp. 2405UD68-3]|uniref:exodeoxyribonuclease V subunit beta n=1 Tax=Marinomonas sp. 2405UD68-3 TaxID=3391835 RepID=UPI0039C93F62